MRIAYIVPVPTLMTFVYNEMVEVQEAGHEMIMVPLRPEPPPKVPVRILNRLRPENILPANLISPAILGRALQMILTRPLRVLGTFISLHWAAGLNPFAQVGILIIAPKALATAWWLRRLRVDRIHAHFAAYTTTCAGIAGSVSDIPFSFTAHAYDIYCTAKNLRNDTLEWKLHHAMQVFVISEHGRSLLQAKLPAADRGRVHRVYVGIPMDLFKVQAPAPINSDGIRLLCIASYDTKKGIDTLLGACAFLKNHSVPFRLHVYGQGPLRQALSDQIASLDLNQHVKLGNPIPQEEVAKELAACHIFVMPCRKDPKTGDIDGIPTVFMEAMATGRPVISCPLAGIPELVKDGETGLLVEPDDPAGLAQAITRLALDDSLRNQLGRRARALAEQQHNQRANTHQFLRVLINDDSIVG